jgi:hypothetical protein
MCLAIGGSRVDYVLVVLRHNGIIMRVVGGGIITLEG